MLVVAAVSQYRPCDARQLIRQRDDHHIGVSAAEQRAYPRADRRLLLGEVDQGCPCAMDQLGSQVFVASLVDPRFLVFPPVECCCGVSPSQAARSRPFAKAYASPMAARSAVASRRSRGSSPVASLGRLRVSGRQARHHRRGSADPGLPIVSQVLQEPERVFGKRVSLGDGL